MSDFINEASDLFLFVSSIAVIAGTIILIIVGYQVAKAMEELRGLAKLLRGEVEAFSSGRKEVLLRTRFAQKWLRLMGERLFLR